METRTYGANGRQVAGTHYQARTQCWDFCIDNNLNGLSYQIVGYLTRWERAGSMVDLDKAQHYLDKLREAIIEGRLIPSGGPGGRQVAKGVIGLADRPLPMPPAGRPTPVRDMINELQPEKTPAEERLAHDQQVKGEKDRIEQENRRAAGSNI